jgi:hypothetical protein
MVDNVKITAIDKQVALDAGWATEDTLKKLLNNGIVTVGQLKEIGKILAKDDKNLLEAIEKSANGLQTVDGTLKAGQQRTTDGLADLTDETEKNNAELRGLGRAFNLSIRDLANATSAEGIFRGLAASTQHLQQHFKGFGELSKPLQFAIKSFGLTAGAAAVLYEKIIKVTKSTEELYASGMIFQGGMRGLTDAASAAGVSVETFAKMLSKYGAVGATLGVDTLAKVNGMFLEQTHLGADLMMTQQEASEAFFDSLETLRSSGRLASMSEDQLVRTGKNLVQSFNDLSVETGRNRAEIAKTTTEIMKMPDVNVLQRMFPPDQQEKFAKTMAGLSAEFGEGSKEMASMVAQVGLAGGSLGTLPGEMASIVNLVPGLQQAMISASRGDPEGAKKMRDAIGAMDPAKIRNLMVSFPEAGKVINSWQQQTQQAIDAERRRSKMSAEDLEKERQAKAEAARALEVQNRVTAAFSRFGNSFDKLAVAMSNVLLPAVDMISSGFEFLASVVNKFTGAIDATGPVGQIIAATVPAVLLALYSSKGIAGIMRIFKRMGAGALEALKGGGGLKDLAAPPKLGPLEGLGKGLGSIGEGIGGVGRGAGGLIKSILTGLAEGISELGKPAVFKGIAAMALLAGDLFLTAKALKAFNEVEWGSLVKAGLTLGGLGLAMWALTPILEPFAIAVGAAATTLTLAAPEIVVALLELAGFGVALLPVAAALRIAAPAFEAFGNIISKTLSGVASIITSIGDSISHVFDSISKVSFDQFVGATLAIGGLVAGLSAAAVAAPFIWIGSRVISNALEKIGEGLAIAIDASNTQIVSMLVKSLRELSGINGQSLVQTAVGLRVIGNVLSRNLFDTSIDFDKLEGFLQVFSVLAAHKQDIISGAGSIAAMGFATSQLTPDKIAGIQRLSDMFSTYDGLAGAYLRNIFHTEIEISKVEAFAKIFETLGKYENAFISGANSLIALGAADISEDKVRGLQLLSSMFSKGWFGGLFDSVIDKKYVQKFVEMFRTLGSGTARDAIIHGAGSMAAMFSMQITAQKVEGLHLLADMFSTTWFGKLFRASVDTDLINDFIKLFAKLGDGEDSIVAGSNSLWALMQMGITTDKVNSLQELSKMFSSTWFGSLFSATFDQSMIDGFVNFFKTFGNVQKEIINGIGTFAALFSVDWSKSKMDAIGNLPDMFSAYAHPDRILGNVDGLVQIFKKFADNENSIENGVNAINAISSLDLTGLNQIRALNDAIYGNGNPIVVNPTTSPAAGTINDAASQYYARTTGQFDKMIELLTQVNTSNQRLIDINTNGFRDTTNAISSTSGRIY